MDTNEFNLDGFDDEMFDNNDEIDNLDLDLNDEEVIDLDTDDSIELDDIDLENAEVLDEDSTGNELEIDSEQEEPEDKAEDYVDGAIVDDIDLHDDVEEDYVMSDDTEFIKESGKIVVQDISDDAENGFELIYVDIDKIAITQRIRKMESVEGLVQSIQSTGLLKPLVVGRTLTDGLYVLLDGYRRIQACARAGKTKVPCIVNNKVNTPEIPILEAMYNHSKPYSIREQVDYIDYLEKEKGIMNPAMIEYLLQMNSGDYTKLKDILNDNDDDIVTKLMDGVYDIQTAFKKLEQRRKKETLEEKENKKAARVYDNEEESGADQIEGSGEEANGDALTEEQISALAINPENLDNDLDESSLDEMIEEDKGLEGFKPHKQKPGAREYIDPIIKKSVMTRDNSTCQCCKRGGEQYVDVLDYHHLLPTFLGGADTPENGIMLCVACHRLVHLYSTDDLHIDSALLTGNYDELTDEQKSHYENEEIFEDEKKRFKRIIKLGSVIRKGIVAKGMNKDQYKKEHSNVGIGRRKPGVNAEQETT
jgi:uncharacterized ParB-like nuclease family protein